MYKQSLLLALLSLGLIGNPTIQKNTSIREEKASANAAVSLKDDSKVWFDFGSV